MHNYTLASLHREFLKSEGVSTDSRQAMHGKLFFALKGEKFDGNRFATDALEAGARLVITDRSDLEGKEGCLVSKDPLKLLQDLAAYHRQHCGIEVVAITGSNGKTTTKELMAAILEKKYRILATRGNLNNHIGVPLTLLSIRDEELAVVEMGANHAGEIALLSALADPGVGLITNIGKAHLEGFGSPEGVLRAKAELYVYLSASGGKAIVDGLDPLLLGKAKEVGVDTVVAGPEGDLRVDGMVLEKFPYLVASLWLAGSEYQVKTRLSGAYNLQNIRLAAAVGMYFDVPVRDIIRAISEYRPENQRSQVLEGGKNRIILDAYNANPSSMREALDGLSGYGGGPTMAILGEMAELGGASEDEHRELAEWIGTLGLDRVYLAGPTFFKTCEPSHRTGVFRDRETLGEHLAADPPEGYTILVKGSRIMELEQIVPLLQ